MRSHLAPLLALLLPLSAQAKRDPAEVAYEEARRSYYVLKDDAARRKLRHHWLNVASKFEAVASHYPKSERAPDALYTAAELLNSLSRLSFVVEDQQAAIADYTRVVEAHSRHRLADDAAVTLARIYFERMDQPETARRIITSFLAKHSKGDRIAELKSLLASLPPPPKAAPAPVPARKPAEPAPAPVVASAPEPVKPAPTPQPPVIRVDLSKPAEPATAQASATTGGERPSSSPLLDAISQQAREASATPSSPAPVETKTAETKPVEPKAVEVKVAETKPVEPKAVEVKVAETKPVEPKPVEVKFADAKALPAPRSAELLGANKPVTAAVDEHMAQARLKAAAKVSNGAELTLAEQLGLKVRRVVIDAGHGGHDTGAISRKGLKEKDVTLAISRKLARELRERGLEVLLTRDEDRYLKLEERARLANDTRGDLFISIHCNSATTSKLRGIETYTLNTSADRYSIRLAARENASSEKGISDLQFILADLATKANTEESTRLANQVQRNLVSHLSANYSGVKNLGTKEALFYVLLGARMPAILVETSFLSHPEEEKRLASEAYQDEVAQAIAQGVEDFVGGRRQVAKAPSAVP
ncbi:N-acetylmuramoyl-L-alanine amidase [Cystobacter fuscus DSM 2262]|uniref:N-acetylmuramoyl-L-alanine amidase n=1 Tax=Cystobacter fuscus (strain ATCC 25194 / DSM 2262 / NBRC 100088 / M29) TaxID=1242864 RepID=S9Q3T9_CYSF2|nr:N-acetylmuramoyl-L-alanine amidase [Cystobacter fuscus]EPX55974.1 N-acetylmuramoyl-L-alanine amidase [Cystobacter fuscus DSM 2262]